MGNDGTSLRVNVDDGKVITDGNHKYRRQATCDKGKTPNIVAGAYTNSFKGTKAPTCSTSTARSAPWSSRRRRMTACSTLSASSASGRPVAFDILSDGKGGNEAWLMAGDTLYSVDLPPARRRLR